MDKEGYEIIYLAAQFVPSRWFFTKFVKNSRMDAALMIVFRFSLKVNRRVMNVILICKIILDYVNNFFTCWFEEFMLILTWLIQADKWTTLFQKNVIQTLLRQLGVRFAIEFMKNDVYFNNVL